MQSFYEQLQGSTCNGQQAQAEKEKEIQELRKEQQKIKHISEKKCQKFVKNKERRKTERELQYSQKIQISDDESKKNVSSLAESVESGKNHPPALNEK